LTPTTDPEIRYYAVVSRDTGDTVSRCTSLTADAELTEWLGAVLVEISKEEYEEIRY